MIHITRLAIEKWKTKNGQGPLFFSVNVKGLSSAYKTTRLIYVAYRAPITLLYAIETSIGGPYGFKPQPTYRFN